MLLLDEFNDRLVGHAFAFDDVQFHFDFRLVSSDFGQLIGKCETGFLFDACVVFLGIGVQ